MPTEQMDIRTDDGAVINIIFSNDDTQPAKGAVIVIHGFGEHSGSYNELIEKLVAAGYACAIFNQRGHGALNLGVGNQGNKTKNAGSRQKDMRGIIPSYQCFLDDIDAVSAAVKQHAPDMPVALYGHSMGGNIVINYLLKQNHADYSCAVLESPWLGLYKKVNPLVTVLANILGRLSPKIAIINKLSPNDITSDSAKADFIRNDHLYHNRISMRMITGIIDGCKYALENASKLTIPVYLASAGNDRIVSNRAIEEFTGAAGSNVTLKVYDSCHAIHNDTEREALYQDVISYLDEYLKK